MACLFSNDLIRPENAGGEDESPDLFLEKFLKNKVTSA